jgi:uncharacterized membrane protein YsdA (DUF1294 family)/cold shock CspA family protein
VNAKLFTGRIVEWNRDRGFGYLEHDGDRVFLHIREFSERHKAPEIGDRIRFVTGVDRQGRPCAKQAAHVNDGGRFGVPDGLVLLLLMAAPAVAIYRVGETGGWQFAAVCWAGFSGMTYWAYALDKKNAQAGAAREPEKMLHLMESIGGWPGAFVAQRRLRHKSTKLGYQFVFWSIVALHEFIAIDALRGWPMMRHLLDRIAALR